MDDYERQFYLRLVKALPECYVFPQVSFSAFLNSSNKWDRRYEVRGRFNRLVADFILCDCESFRLLAVIELDGNSHDRKDVQEKDKKRDAYLDEAGIKHKRFRAPPQPSEEEIKGWFQRVIQN
ncbi:MAG: DUF2726 domain-containing protein [Alphaproteobacteria bacterium]|nr:DUF2726 domain-containing protein [Alphaproteobacteria bacterium]